MLRRISSQLQAHRLGHKVERQEGSAVSSPQWCVHPYTLPYSPLIRSRAGVVSAPLWNSEKSKFAGMLTVLDIIHLIQYYYDNLNYEAAAADVETFRLELLRGVCSLFSTIFHETLPDRYTSDIEKSLGVATPPMLKEHPNSTLYAAAKLLIQTHARRLPLLDYDTETGQEVIVSVLTQYRLLKFISINVILHSHLVT
jgi:5'-AMP-activated protein kinase regulatory gamma subunit